jgi:hypothetical protein
MVTNMGDKRRPGEGINLDLPWKSVPADRVLELERWFRESPLSVWTFVVLVVAGEHVDDAWVMAEGA